LSTGLSDNPVNRKIALRKAAIIEDDIFKERFDSSLEKYKPQSGVNNFTPLVTS
jgi:hypothetical protein